MTVGGVTPVHGSVSRRVSFRSARAYTGRGHDSSFLRSRWHSYNCSEKDAFESISKYFVGGSMYARCRKRCLRMSDYRFDLLYGRVFRELKLFPDRRQRRLERATMTPVSAASSNAIQSALAAG